jgi:high-affinity iron transporter
LDVDSLSSGLLTGFRQAVGPALTVSLILAYLAKTGNTRHFDKIWIGAGVALALSAIGGAVLWIAFGDFEFSGWSMSTDVRSAEDLFDGIAMLAGATALTWMLFWMRRTADDIGTGRVSRGDAVMVGGSIFGLAVLAFTDIFRQGVEVAWFLIGHATDAAGEGSAFNVITATVIGIIVATVIGFALFRGARLVDRRRFVAWAGIALIFIAAGQLSHAVREFILAGWITVGVATAFDIGAVLPHTATAETGLVGVIGSILRAAFGYSSRPELITFLTWIAYVVVVLIVYLRPASPAGLEIDLPETPAQPGSRPSSRGLAKAT